MSASVLSNTCIVLVTCTWRACLASSGATGQPQARQESPHQSAQDCLATGRRHLRQSSLAVRNWPAAGYITNLRQVPSQYRHCSFSDGINLSHLFRSLIDSDRVGALVRVDPELAC